MSSSANYMYYIFINLNSSIICCFFRSFIYIHIYIYTYIYTYIIYIYIYIYIDLVSDSGFGLLIVLSAILFPFKLPVSSVVFWIAFFSFVFEVLNSNVVGSFLPSTLYLLLTFSPIFLAKKKNTQSFIYLFLLCSNRISHFNLTFLH